MKHQLSKTGLFKTRLLAGSLFLLSSGGTLALFGLMPVVAQKLSADPAAQNLPLHAEERQAPTWQFSRQPLRPADRS